MRNKDKGGLSNDRPNHEPAYKPQNKHRIDQNDLKNIQIVPLKQSPY